MSAISNSLCDIMPDDFISQWRIYLPEKSVWYHTNVAVLRFGHWKEYSSFNKILVKHRRDHRKIPKHLQILPTMGNCCGSEEGGGGSSSKDNMDPVSNCAWGLCWKSVHLNSMIDYEIICFGSHVCRRNMSVCMITEIKVHTNRVFFSIALCPGLTF